MIIFDIFRRRRPEPLQAPIQISAAEQMIADAEHEADDIGAPLNEDERERRWQEWLASLTPEGKLVACQRRAKDEAERERAALARETRKARRDGTR